MEIKINKQFFYFIGKVVKTSKCDMTAKLANELINLAEIIFF